MADSETLRNQNSARQEKKSHILAEVLVMYGVVFFVLGVCSQLPWAYLREYSSLVAAALFLYLPILLFRYRRFSFKEYGLTLHPLGKSLKAYFILSVVVFSLFGLGYYLLQKFHLCGTLRIPPFLVQCLPSMSPRPPLPRPVWLWVLNTVFLIALPEECFFRGYLQGRMAKVVSPVASVILTSILFALGHVITSLNLFSLLIFFPSLLFGGLRLKTGSILASILFHASCNIVIVFLHHFL